jgi:hypothetical protein
VHEKNRPIPVLRVTLLGAALVVVLVVVILVLVALLWLLAPLIIVAVRLLLAVVLAVIVGSTAVLAIHCVFVGEWRYARFIVVSIALLALLRILAGACIVVILAVLLVVVVVGVLALLALGVALSLAVAIVVLASLRMSGHLWELLDLGCGTCETNVNKLSYRRETNAETAGVGGAAGLCVPQTMGIRSGRAVKLIVVWLPRDIAVDGRCTGCGGSMSECGC